eukprot:CAMPEP_0113668968 /NCGR_PEP_ID=MMETSP0038_2-20120614/4299_1 /TAXON_ID=2898 /ORGANISM="Cryptomonas paramecium" /LENGTH=300 /DNA_ID=CAMNT_0000584779 /DNA_START=211 /DNA_END=1110 /DNA_ORIENTATION=- /assembly_acc=CAM_ASM_000170
MDYDERQQTLREQAMRSMLLKKQQQCRQDPLNVSAATNGSRSISPSTTNGDGTCNSGGNAGPRRDAVHTSGVCREENEDDSCEMEIEYFNDSASAPSGFGHSLPASFQNNCNSQIRPNAPLVHVQEHSTNDPYATMPIHALPLSREPVIATDGPEHDAISLQPLHPISRDNILVDNLSTAAHAAQSSTVSVPASRQPSEPLSEASNEACTVLAQDELPHQTLSTNVADNLVVSIDAFLNEQRRRVESQPATVGAFQLATAGASALGSRGSSPALEVARAIVPVAAPTKRKTKAAAGTPRK